MLTPLGPEIWMYDGPTIIGAAGFHFPTRMVVARLDGGDLWIWSPVTLKDEIVAAVTALGTVRYLIAPNAFHHMALPDWAARFPEAEVLAAPGVKDKHPGLRLTELGAETKWPGEFDQVVYPNTLTDEFWFRHRASGTLIITDMVQQMPRGWYHGWRALVARADKMVGPVPAVPRKFRLATRDKRRARQAVRQMLDHGARTLVVAHGPIVTKDVHGTLRRAFQWLSV